MTGPDRFPTRLLLVGCGAMAGAMLDRWLATGLDPARVTVVRPSGAPVADGVRVLTTMPGGIAPDLVLLGVKPALLDVVAADVAAALTRDTILVSILAGVEHRALADRFAAATIVRAMPNLPVRLGAGVVALNGPADDRVRDVVTRLMAPLGLVEWIADEASLDAVTVLAGSGPAFLYRFVDALAAAGVDLGLDRDQAARLAIATVAGAGRLAQESPLSPAELADRVASKGGSTRAGLDRLDAAGTLDRLVAETLTAARDRNRAMAEQARRP